MMFPKILFFILATFTVKKHLQNFQTLFFCLLYEYQIVPVIHLNSCRLPGTRLIVRIGF